MSNTDEPETPVTTTDLITFVNSTERSSDYLILRWIESLNLSLDTKALLADHLKLWAEVGSAVLRLGIKVLDQLVALLIKCSDYAYKRIGCTY